jgi:hypothetical protein
MMKKKVKTATIPKPRLILRGLSIFLLACLSFCLILTTLSQARRPPKSNDYALIYGTVWSPDDHPVAGVKVRIRRVSDKKSRWELYSNRRGEFVQRVPTGKQEYIVWVDTKDYKSPNGKHLQPGPEVTVRIESNERADVGLHLQ